MSLLRLSLRNLVTQCNRASSLQCLQNRRPASTVLIRSKTDKTTPHVVLAKFGTPKLLSNNDKKNTKKTKKSRKKRSEKSVREVMSSVKKQAIDAQKMADEANLDESIIEKEVRQTQQNEKLEQTVADILHTAGQNAKIIAEITEKEAKEMAEMKAKEKAEREAIEKVEKEAKEIAEKEAKEKAEKAEKKAREKAEREAKEIAEKEAKEKAEREAKEKAEREAKEKAEREAKEIAEKEAKEKAEREAKEKAEKEALEAVIREEARQVQVMKDAEAAVKAGHDPVKDAFVKILKQISEHSTDSLPSLTEDVLAKHEQDLSRIKKMFGNDDALDSFPEIELLEKSL